MQLAALPSTNNKRSEEANRRAGQEKYGIHIRYQINTTERKTGTGNAENTTTASPTAQISHQTRMRIPQPCDTIKLHVTGQGKLGGSTKLRHHAPICPADQNTTNTGLNKYFGLGTPQYGQYRQIRVGKQKYTKNRRQKISHTCIYFDVKHTVRAQNCLPIPKTYRGHRHSVR